MTDVISSKEQVYRKALEQIAKGENPANHSPALSWNMSAQDCRELAKVALSAAARLPDETLREPGCAVCDGLSPDCGLPCKPVETRADEALVRGLVFDHVGWVCSVCRGWNAGSDAMCVHSHQKTSREPTIVGVDLASGPDRTTYACSSCGTELAFEGDVCGLCLPVQQP